jgi:hypothetical protein
MDPLLTEFLAHQAQTNDADLAGTDLRLRVPLREGVINDLLARTVVATQPSVRALDVAIAVLIESGCERARASAHSRLPTRVP